MRTASSRSGVDVRARQLLRSFSTALKADKPIERGIIRKLGISFFLFGLINNVLYVIILSAALDLVPPSTPKGLVLFCDIAPSLLAKLGWPYILKGRIRYTKRVLGCCFLSVLGMLVVARFEGVNMRLLGISLASFSSGLGELTYLQLSTTYSVEQSGHSVGYFASGTGAAGLIGAGLWWIVRGFGVREGVGLSTFLPFITPLAYFFLLPSSSTCSDTDSIGSRIDTPGYAPIPLADPADPLEDDGAAAVPAQVEKEVIALTVREKLVLVRPLLLKFMLPLFAVYLLEYTINQGISPTLVYPVPHPESHPILSRIFGSIRDYYPFWQLVYQTFVFFSRSSISAGLPPLPTSLLPLPAVVQAVILTSLALESAFGLLPEDLPQLTIPIIFLMIGLEGICGGLAYVNVFYRIGQEEREEEETERSKQEREFKIGSIGFSDGLGILTASLIAMPTELELCKAQVRRGKSLCMAI
ncbi:hypothetical protein BOTBODRAFT_117036 [Botryobasidium botryosum FD-172 SS1]|uniref:Protein BTN n=1 Tax=Botryobasidium botryosum (strain FD-172 SS1) TaxID=930990 RepID=A0A067MCD9_BOTB1|nr:hypothetical protein BOTBODRAFT_117036 [Botryobasidium botryosum FD-172 SS1]